MNLGELRSLCDLYVPAGKPTKISDNEQRLLLNEGALEIASRLNLLKSNTKINIVADTSEIVISSSIIDFLRLDDSPLYYNYGTVTSPSWNDLDPYERYGLDNFSSNWRNNASGTPQRYFFQNNIIRLDPVPDTSKIDGLWVYYIARPSKMVTESSFPFGDVSGVEIPQYTILSDTLLKYYKARANYILNKPDSYLAALKEYETDLSKKLGVFQQRRDIAGFKNTKFKIER